MQGIAARIQSRTDADTAAFDPVFVQLSSQADALSESSRFLDNVRGPFAQEAAWEQHAVSQDENDPLTANASHDPLSNPSRAAESTEQVLSTPSNNIANNSPQNLAGAYAGAGQGPGGASTTNPSSGGAAPGSGGSANLHLPNLTQLQQMTPGGNGNTPSNAPVTPAAPGAVAPQTSSSTSQKALTPGGDPPIAFTEGIAQQVLVTTFTDSDGNTDPSQYSVSINWGNGQTTPGQVQYSSGQFQV